MNLIQKARMLIKRNDDLAFDVNAIDCVRSGYISRETSNIPEETNLLKTVISLLPETDQPIQAIEIVGRSGVPHVHTLEKLQKFLNNHNQKPEGCFDILITNKTDIDNPEMDQASLWLIGNTQGIFSALDKACPDVLKDIQTLMPKCTLE